MPDPTTACTALLAELIAYRTNNPGGDEVALCDRLAIELDRRGADEVVVLEVPRDAPGRGGFVFARYGTPELIVNVHVDTVPVNTGWTRDPFDALVTGDEVVGLGAADTKGAIAAVLTALDATTPENVGILFSGDEERATTCMRAFLASPHAQPIKRAIVCEPTSRSAGVRHRGVGAFSATFRGHGGHSSGADTMPKPMVTMARLAIALDELGSHYLSRGPADMKGLCLNVAGIDGGVAFNVVPETARLTFSVRPPPTFDRAAFDRDLKRAVGSVDPSIELTCELHHAPFATRDVDGYRQLIGDHVAELTGLQFWTEAAILSAAGIDAIVVGPGDIEHAHAADELVTIADLTWAIALFTRVFEASRS